LKGKDVEIVGGREGEWEGNGNEQRGGGQGDKTEKKMRPTKQA